MCSNPYSCTSAYVLLRLYGLLWSSAGPSFPLSEGVRASRNLSIAYQSLEPCILIASRLHPDCNRYANPHPDSARRPKIARLRIIEPNTNRRVSDG